MRDRSAATSANSAATNTPLTAISRTMATSPSAVSMPISVADASRSEPHLVAGQVATPARLAGEAPVAGHHPPSRQHQRRASRWRSGPRRASGRCACAARRRRATAMRSGSHTTTSASAPTCSEPLRGHSPNVRAGASAHSRTQSAAVRCPARTPAHTRASRVSMPGSPPGISVKSAQPLGAPGGAGAAVVHPERAVVGGDGVQVALARGRATAPRGATGRAAAACTRSSRRRGPRAGLTSRCRYCGQVSPMIVTPRSCAARMAASAGAELTCTM